ncbi:MAG: phosphotransferase family protein, partial [Deltaproteobacteria bacterium]|nr:phosphotransferase family protein [Deltaproteobacteria bacterium]
MSAKLDAAKAPRAGEELDLGKLTQWMAQALPDLGAPLEVKQFPRGYSNLTYLVRTATTEVVLRRPPKGAKVKAGHDMSREARILTAVGSLPPPGFPMVPRVLAKCEDESVLGAPFYAMQRLQGVILRGGNLQAMIPDGLAPEKKRGLDLALIDLLADLHKLDVTKEPLSALGKPAGYIERQVRGWTERYAAAKTDDIPEVDE